MEGMAQHAPASQRSMSRCPLAPVDRARITKFSRAARIDSGRQGAISCASRIFDCSVKNGPKYALTILWVEDAHPTDSFDVKRLVNLLSMIYVTFQL